MKKGVGMVGTVVVALVLALLAYVRLAPVDPERWHLPVAATESADLVGGAVRVLDGDQTTFLALDKAARALPRTSVLAGSVDEGRITYVTRSFVFGFPDMTTIELAGEQVRMFARLRFGQSDMGVNRKRLEDLLSAIK